MLIKRNILLWNYIAFYKFLKFSILFTSKAFPPTEDIKTSQLYDCWIYLNFSPLCANLIIVPQFRNFNEQSREAFTPFDPHVRSQIFSRHLCHPLSQLARPRCSLNNNYHQVDVLCMTDFLAVNPSQPPEKSLPPHSLDAHLLNPLHSNYYSADRVKE